MCIILSYISYIEREEKRETFQAAALRFMRVSHMHARAQVIGPSYDAFPDVSPEQLGNEGMHIFDVVIIRASLTLYTTTLSTQERVLS